MPISRILIGIGESPKIGGAGPVRLEDLVLAAVGVTAGRFRGGSWDRHVFGRCLASFTHAEVDLIAIFKNFWAFGTCLRGLAGGFLRGTAV